MSEVPKSGRVSYSCLKDTEKAISSWVVLFPLAITLFFLISFINDLSIVNWDFALLKWIDWTRFGFMIVGFLASLFLLIWVKRVKVCEK